MTPEEWPIWIPREGGRAPALRAGRDRLPTVRQDFFLDPAHRLTEQERALMTAMLHRLVADIASEIQIALTHDWLPANDDIQALIERLSKAGLLDIEEVLALFLRRADEERVAAAVAAMSRQPTPNLIQPFVSDPDADIAAAAMALLIGRGRRRDRYGRSVVELDDVPPESAAALVYVVSAGLRARIPAHVPAGEAERQLQAAATAVLEQQDSSRSPDIHMARFVSLLTEAGRLDDALVAKAIELGDLSFLAHALGLRAGICHSICFEELLSGDSGRVMMLLRLAGCPRGTAAQLLATLGEFLGLLGDFEHLDTFDGWTAEQLDAARSWLQLDPRFQTALRGVGHGNGHRTH